MKNRKTVILHAVLLGLMLIAPLHTYPYSDSGKEPLFSGPVSQKSDNHHCTVFTVEKDGQVFFGGNDDYINPDSYYWVDPGDSLRYGVIWIGTPDNVQQGVNEMGLAYDANGLPRYDVNPHNEREHVTGSYTIYPIRIMHECAKVEEVINWVNTHQWHTFMHDQMQFADKSGDAVIISAGEDGEVVFTRKPKGDGFIVSTNFNVANPENGFSYPCWRYDRATEMLDALIQQEKPLTIGKVRDVLDAVHVESINSWTIESMLVDLTNGRLYIYLFHQYDQPLILNVSEEIVLNRPAGDLSKLFPEDVRKEAKMRYLAIQDKAKNCQRYGVSWIILILTSLLVYLIFSKAKLKTNIHCIIAIVILGPLALLIWLIFMRNKKSSLWIKTAQEVMGDLVPTVISYFIVLCILLLVPAIQVNWPLQLTVVFGLPVLCGWLVFHALILNPYSRLGFGKFLLKRLPHAISATVLGMAGIIVVSIPLVNQSIQICHVWPLSFWTLINLWAIVIAGGFIAALFLFFFEYHAVKRSYLAWSVLMNREGKLETQSWRQLWWCVLLCIALLVLCMIAGITLSNMLA